MAAGLRRCAHGLHCTVTCFLVSFCTDRALYTPNSKSVDVVSRSGRSSLQHDWLKAQKPSDLLLFSFDPFTFFPASSSSVRDFRCCPGVDDLESAINDTDIRDFFFEFRSSEVHLLVFRLLVADAYILQQACNSTFVCCAIGFVVSWVHAKRFKGSVRFGR